MMRLFLSFPNMNKNARGDGAGEVGESQNMAVSIWKFENVIWKIMKKFKSGRPSQLLTNWQMKGNWVLILEAKLDRDSEC